MNILKILIIPVFTMLSACTGVNSEAETEITRGKDTVSKIEIAVSKINASDTSKETQTSKLIFRALGSEPGWLAEIFSDKLRVLLNNGQDSLWINDKLEDFVKQQTFTYSKELAVNGKTNILILRIDNKPCTEEASGETAERTVVITYQNKTYKGCGNFLK